EQVGVRGVGERAVALLGGDAAADLLGLVAEPDAAGGVVVLAEVAQLVGADAAGPDRAIGVDVGAGPAGVAGNHLVLLVEDALDQPIVADAEGLGDSGDAAITALLDVGDEPVDGLAVVLLRGRDRQADGVQLHARLGDLRDEL